MSGPSVLPETRPPAGCLGWLVASSLSGTLLVVTVVLSLAALAAVRWAP